VSREERSRPGHHSLRLLAFAWAFVAVGAAGLVLSYDSLPVAVIVYRPLWADAPTTGTRSFLTVGRIALMGVGQLGAATAMVFASRASFPWQRFWSWLGLVAGVKTLLECMTLMLPDGSGLEMLLTLSVFSVVGAFAVSAVWWWRRGYLRAHPALTRGPLFWLLGSIALWAAFAMVPGLFA